MSRFESWATLYRHDHSPPQPEHGLPSLPVLPGQHGSTSCGRAAPGRPNSPQTRPGPVRAPPGPAVPSTRCRIAGPGASNPRSWAGHGPGPATVLGRSRSSAGHGPGPVTVLGRSGSGAGPGPVTVLGRSRSWAGPGPVPDVAGRAGRRRPAVGCGRAAWQDLPARDRDRGLSAAGPGPPAGPTGVLRLAHGSQWPSGPAAGGRLTARRHI
jgi:hypothetical protein